MDENNEELYFINGDMFTYCIDINPKEMFCCENKSYVFSYKTNCYCYDNFEDIKNKKFFAYINEKNNGQNLSYEHIFNEIDKQISTQFKSIAKNKNIKYENLICNHIFIEGFNEKTQLEYEICCGS